MSADNERPDDGTELGGPSGAPPPPPELLYKLGTKPRARRPLWTKLVPLAVVAAMIAWAAWAALQR